MCEVTVVCKTGGDLPSVSQLTAEKNFTLYYLQTRTFWSQVSTIWEWFIANFGQEQLAARGHTRPAHVYEVKDGEWRARNIIEARLILEPGVIELGDVSIDRRSRAWQRTDTQETIGACARLALWDTLEILEKHAPGDRS